MATAYVGLGSNVDAANNLRLAVAQLRELYGGLRVSPVYRNAALGFDGDDFLNLVAGFETNETPLRILERIEAIHERAGRVRGPDRMHSRTLDIDLLLYDDLVDRGLRIPRADVLRYSFVLRPLADIAPQALHPESGRTFAAHWRDYDAASHPLTRVDVVL